MNNKKEKKSFLHRLIKILIYVALGLFIIYTIAGFFIVPMIIKSEAVDYIKEELKRHAEIESVSFNPFTFSLSVEEFKLFEKDKKEIFISFKEFFINFSLLPLINKELDFEEIKLIRPSGTIVRLKGEKFNFSDLIKQDTVKTSGSPTPGGPDKPWDIFIKKFEIKNLHLLVSDSTVTPASETKIDSFSVKVSNLHFNSSDTSDFHLTSNLRLGGTFSLGGRFSMQPLKASLKFNFDKASLMPFAPYIAQYTYLRLDDGKLTIDGSLEYDASQESKTAELAYKAITTIDNLKLFDTKNNERFLEWNSFILSDISGKLNPSEVSIGSVDVDGLYSRVAISDDTTFNITDVIRESSGVTVQENITGNKSDTTLKGTDVIKKSQGITVQKENGENKSDTTRKVTDVTKSPGITIQKKNGENKSDTTHKTVHPFKPEKKIFDFKYEIGRIKIKNSEMYFSDFSLPLKFASKIHNLNGEVIGFSSENPLGAEIKLEGIVDEYGSAKINGKMDPLDPIAYSNIKINFHNIEMTDLTPYTVEFLGYEVASGKLSLDITYKIDKGILTSYNKIFLNKFTLGDEYEGQEGLGLPIKLAIALLKDANDNIDLDLEVEGDLNDPETDTGALVWWAVKRVLTTIVTAPFRFLGGLLGIGGEDLESVDFEVGSAKLENHQFEKMINLSKIMAERPGIVLEIYGAVDTITDGMAMREAKFDSIYNQKLMGGGSDSTIKRTNTDYTKGQQILEEMFVKAYNDSLLNLVKSIHSVDSVGSGDLRNYLEELKEKIVSVLPVTEIEFLKLAAERSEALRNHMMTVHQMPAERIAIKENEIYEDEDRNWVRCRLGIGSID